MKERIREITPKNKRWSNDHRRQKLTEPVVLLKIESGKILKKLKVLLYLTATVKVLEDELFYFPKFTSFMKNAV